MSEHQTRLWRRMIETLDAYGEGKIDFYGMVGELEGALDAGEFRETRLVQNWYSFWGELETLRAVYGNNAPPSTAAKHVAAMRDFLMRELDGREV